MDKITDIPKLPRRPDDAHKGTFGRVAIIGGSTGFSGAPALAGCAALRAGAGLVRIAVPETVLSIVASIDPCYTTVPLPADNDGAISSAAVGVVLTLAQQNDILAFGPGVGTAAGPRDVLNAILIKPELRIVIDADGLNCLAKDPTWIDRKNAAAILTPHPGEMKRLWISLFREPIPGDRSQQALALAQKTDCTVVLKGAGTVVTNGKKVYTNNTGNPGMATAGSGDVLTGIIAALAVRLSDLDAAILAVYLHGLAGDIAAQKFGTESLVATDIIDSLPDAFMKQ